LPIQIPAYRNVDPPPLSTQLMASHIAARLPADSTTPPSLANRIHVFLIERRVAVSVALFAVLSTIDLVVFQRPPHDVLNLADPWSLAGVAFVLAGLLIRSWAAGTLRKYRRLITTGPYAVVRNPLYIGSFLMMGGFCALLGDWPILVLVMVPMIALYWLAVRDEEQVLAQAYPDQWPDYVARVPRFIPRLTLPTREGWSLAQWRNNHEFQAWIGAAAGLVALRAWCVLGA
jgi:protein-S-isoprenylcysteine O-methyltransferase Ste14